MTVFVDRDGVINHNRSDHVLFWKDFTFEDGAIEALRLLNLAGYEVVVITNQAAIERGLVTAAEVDYLHSQMIEAIEEGGGRVKSVLYCPHRPEVGCFCRKPQPGMLFQAADRFQVKLHQSWLIGDHLTDIQAGLAAGCKALLVLTGRGQIALEAIREQKLEQQILSQVPIKRNLLEAVEYILTTGHIAHE